MGAQTKNQRDYSPVSWTNYFDEAHDIDFECEQGQSFGSNDNNNHDTTDSFRVYLRNFKPPYSPARPLGEPTSPSKYELSQTELNEYSKVPTLVTIHGGGYSALTWAEFTRYIEQYCTCRVLALDMRAHGDTRVQEPSRMDIDTLVSDVIKVIHATHRLCGFPETPKVVLIGHSMGGAVAIKCATRSPEELPSLAGIVIIDVVEGTAKEALPLMMSVIRARPAKFKTLDAAIEWAIRSGMAKNPNAARVSMPGNLLNLSDGCLGIHNVPTCLSDYDNSVDAQRMKTQMSKIKHHTFHMNLEQLVGSRSSNSPPLDMKSMPNCPLPRVSALIREDNPIGLPPLPPKLPDKIIEEENEDSKNFHQGGSSDGAESLDLQDYKKPLELGSSGFAWRTNLTKTQPFWQGWFDGLSKQLLEAPVQGKFLLLAGIDRLDKALTIGQMQGKFTMKVLPKCGHAVHEDVPQQVASCISEFLVRNKFTTQA